MEWKSLGSIIKKVILNSSWKLLCTTSRVPHVLFIFLFTILPETSGPIEFLTPELQDVYHLRLPFLYGLTHVSKVGSVFTTLAVSLERYFAVCKPLWIRIRRCHPAMYIILVTVFAFGFNVPKFLEFEVSFNSHSSCLLILPHAQITSQKLNSFLLRNQFKKLAVTAT